MKKVILALAITAMTGAFAVNTYAQDEKKEAKTEKKCCDKKKCCKKKTTTKKESK